jgi:hypothetical protein
MGEVGAVDRDTFRVRVRACVCVGGWVYDPSTCVRVRVGGWVGVSFKM